MRNLHIGEKEPDISQPFVGEISPSFGRILRTFCGLFFSFMHGSLGLGYPKTAQNE